jgi:hypothetical protein
MNKKRDRNSGPTRRQFLRRLGQSTLGGWAASRVPAVARDPGVPVVPGGQAEHCILIWLGGGACHIDTWDPKRRGDPKGKKPGSDYAPIETAVPGTQVCEHLPKCAGILDRFNLIRTVHHEVIDEHAAATNRMHTGRPTSGAVVYPSLGSVVAHQRGAIADDAPPYVLIGYPNVTRGPGFLGARYSYVYLVDTQSGPSGFTRPADVGSERFQRRQRMLATMRDRYLQRMGGGRALQDYVASIDAALRLSGGSFMDAFQLQREPDGLREAYGSEIGQRCLLARRLIQRGVRFIEVSHNLNFINGTGWDTHNDGQRNQHVLIRELDHALSALVLDLENQGLLDRTLVVVATEFGRPAQFDGGGGRGHHAKCFSVVLAGGGLRSGITVGETDDLGMNIVSRPVSVPDLHATIYQALGIDPAHELTAAGDRPVPITDRGTPLREIL